MKKGINFVESFTYKKQMTKINKDSGDIGKIEEVLVKATEETPKR